MDTSAKYIKMCEKATEIQSFDIRERFEDSNSYYKNNNISDVWLPRQDQLQEIIDLTDDTAVDLFIICNFYGFCQAWNKEFPTMEQLWLAFVMREKFNKQWTSKKWNNI